MQPSVGFAQAGQQPSTITAEQVRAEIARRKAAAAQPVAPTPAPAVAPQGITADQVKAEIARRKAASPAPVAKAPPAPMQGVGTGVAAMGFAPQTRAQRDGWKPEQLAAVERARKGSTNLDDRLALRSWESGDSFVKLPKSLPTATDEGGMDFDPRSGAMGAPLAEASMRPGAAPAINLPAGFSFQRGQDQKMVLRDPTGGTWTEEYWPDVLAQAQKPEAQEYYRNQVAARNEANRERSPLENFAGDVAGDLAAPFQQNESLRTIVGAPINVGHGLGQGVQNMTNNLMAVGTEARNAVLNQFDPAREQSVAPRISLFDQNAIVDEGGLLSSDAGVIPRIAGQIAAARIPIGQASPFGGAVAMGAKDAAALGLTTEAGTPNLSNMIASDTPVIGGAADMLRSREGDSTAVSMMKNAGEDLLLSGLGYGVLKGVDNAGNMLRGRAPASGMMPPNADPATVAQIRRIMARDGAEQPQWTPELEAKWRKLVQDERAALASGDPQQIASARQALQSAWDDMPAGSTDEAYRITFDEPDTAPPTRPAPAPVQPQPAAQAAPPPRLDQTQPYSAPPEPSGPGVVRRNMDRIVGGAVGATIGGVGDAYAAEGDGGGAGGPLNATTGAVLGIFGPRAVAAAGSRGFRAAARAARSPGARAAFDERVAARAVRKGLVSGGLKTEQEALAAARARFGDKPAAVADLTQDSVGTATGLSRLPGATGEAARARGEDLLANRAGRLERDIGDATGASPATISGDVDRMVALAREQATPAYEKLRTQYGWASLVSPRLQQLGELEILKPHIRGVERYRDTIYATEGRVIGDFEYWDLVKRSLDDAEQSAIARNQAVPYDLDSARQAIVKELDQLVPDYPAARQLGGEAPKMKQAFADGKGLLGGRYSSEEVGRLVEGVTGQPLTALQAGVIRSLVAKTEGPRGAMSSLTSTGARRKLEKVFGKGPAAEMQARFAADAAIMDNAQRINPNVGSVTSQANMGGGEGAMAMAAGALRAVRSPVETALAAMSKSGSYTKAQRDLMGEMLLDGPTPENLARIYRGKTRGGAPTRTPPAPNTGLGSSTRELPGQTSKASPTVAGALVGGGLGYVGSDGDPTATLAGAVGLGAIGAVAGKLAKGKPGPAGNALKSGPAKAQNAKDMMAAARAASAAAFESKASAIEKAGGFGDYTVTRGWKMPEGTLFEVRKGNEVVGTFEFEKRGWSDEYSIHAAVKPEFQRQGIASQFYDHVEKAIGQPLKPNATQTPAGAAFTRKRQAPPASPPVKPSGAPKKPPVKNGFGGSKLPMDEASRMERAREQGFTIDAYHGTVGDFQEFDPTRAGAANGVRMDGAMFFAADPSHADAFSFGAQSGRAMKMAREKAKQIGGDKNWGESQGLEHYERVAKERGYKIERGQMRGLPDVTAAMDAEAGSGRNIMPVKLRMKNPLVIDTPMTFEGRPDMEQMFGTLDKKTIMEAKAAGYDGVVFKDAVDGGHRGTFYVVFDPSNIRGKFAKFDPAQSSSSKLLAGMGGAMGLGTISAGATLPKDEKRKKRA